jgi:hypothetical protein
MSNIMKKVSVGVFAALCVAMMVFGTYNTGCLAGKGQYDPNTQTYNTNAMADVLVVTAQNTRQVAADAFDGLMTIESHNEEALKALNPGIHATAQEVRKNGKKWLDDLSGTIKNYQSARSAENGSKLKASLKVVDDALIIATKYLAEASKKAKVTP